MILMTTLVMSHHANGEDSFVVHNILVNGLQRISLGAVYNHIPITTGEIFSTDKTGLVIKSLFKTGFFQHIALHKEGSTLVVNVVERPSIAKIIFVGNNDISTDDLTSALDKIGLAKGKVFNRQILDKVEQELRRQYFSRGKYSLNIKTNVSRLTRNRVGIKINILEGRAAKIKQINIVGNKIYTDDALLQNFESSTTNILSFYTKDDQYSKQKLSADLERLHSYYLDLGYINFSIKSVQSTITPNKKDIYVTINVNEGDLFTIEKVKLVGDLVIDQEELLKLVQVGPGEVFSGKKAAATSQAIARRLGDESYIFAKVNMVPEINSVLKTVVMTFFVDKGRRVYVQNINISGNTYTRDKVLRRELRQMESSWASVSKIERSKIRLQRLGYFEEVNVETPVIEGVFDKIDVNYSVVEKSSGNLSLGAGFSQTNGLIFNANISQNNVFGSGKKVDITFNNSDTLTHYKFAYFDPYFTLDGISLGYNIEYSDRDAGESSVSRYSTDSINTGFNFGFPLNEHDKLNFNVNFKHTKLTTGSNVSNEINGFINGNGDKFLTFQASVGWTHDTLNKAIFPTSGGQKRFSVLATAPFISDLEYFKVYYKQQQYFPITTGLTFRLLGEIAYGDGYSDTKDLPFFEHYYVGGVHSVRGFDGNTIGPRDSRRDPYGGSSKIIAKAELFFPVPFVDDIKSIRLGSFIDVGALRASDKEFGIGSLKYSVGLSGKWLSPFGTLSVSVSKPFNVGKNDEEQIFQFSFGSRF